MVRVKKLGVHSKRAAAARRMVCSVFETVSGGRQETPRQQRLLHSMSEEIAPQFFTTGTSTNTSPS